ncbi:unnamed protein product, partial [Choristocarpus tenellus]
FFDLLKLLNTPGASSTKDVSWGTWTLPVGWPARGVWPSPPDGSEVNCADRSQSCSLLASGDSFG